MLFKNPIIGGDFPGVSICKRQDDYFLAAGSRHFAPGIPLFHSNNLVQWQQIGFCLTRLNQLPIDNSPTGTGIDSVTMRLHDDVIYLIASVKEQSQHFIIVSENPREHWSAPVWIEHAADEASLFIDHDGKAYCLVVIGAHIRLFEVDLTTGKARSGFFTLWQCEHDILPHSPRLFIRDNQYVLIFAEHSNHRGFENIRVVYSARLKQTFEDSPHTQTLFSFYTENKMNTRTSGVIDLIEADTDSWWSILSIRRSQSAKWHHLGEEIALAPVEWKANQPQIQIQPQVKLKDEIPLIDSDDVRDDFVLPEFQPCWNLLRKPDVTSWSLTDREGWLRLDGQPPTLNDLELSAFVGRRQQHLNCEIAAMLDFEPTELLEEAGLVVYKDETHHYEIAVTKLTDSGRSIIVRRRIGSLAAVVAYEPIEEGLITLHIRAEPTHYHFAYTLMNQDKTFLTAGETHYLSSDATGTSGGIHLGMYATANGNYASAPAFFDWFDYVAL